MTAKLLQRIVLSAGVACLSALNLAFAQPAAEEPPPSSRPARPIILPMTPGAELNRQPAPAEPAKPSKPRIISVPGAGQSPTASGRAPQPERPVKNATTDYWFCNRTSYAVDLAVGIRNGGLFASRGWWTIPAGDCKQVIKGPLTQPAYYTFARSSYAHTGSIRTWGGTHTLCTGKTGFQASSDGSDQCGPGLEPQGFAKVDTAGRTAWTTTLSESPDYRSLDAARIAGLQRLLIDLGRFDGPIDGAAGPKFNEALAQARSSLGILANDLPTLYGKLLAESVKAQATAGLTFCNRTQDIVWSALAMDIQGKKQSQGWWRLQPGQCAKVIKDRLADVGLYAFATLDQNEGSAPQIWGGAHNFCTRGPSFEIEEATECEGRGFKTTGFMQIDTQSRGGITFEFTPRRADMQ